MGTVSADDFETGTASGVAGGTTCIIDFCIPARGESLLDGLKEWRERSKKAVADHTYHMAITGWGDRTAEEMRAVVLEHGITSFKVFMAYKGAIMVDDGELYQVMKHAAKLGAVVTVHAENGDAVFHLQKELVAKGDLGPEFHPVSRPSSVEGEATNRALMMARLHGATAYIVHMTCREAVEALVRAKLEGQKCYGETCPQYLLLDDTVFTKPNFEGSRLRHEPADPAGPPGAPRRAVARARERHARLGRHRPLPVHDEAEEDGEGELHADPERRGRRSRTGSSSSTPTACARGSFDLQRMVALGSTNPARIFGLYPRKGSDRRGRRTPISWSTIPPRLGHAQRQDPPLSLRPQHLRGLQGQREAVARGRERAGAVRGRKSQGGARCRSLPQARGAGGRNSAPGTPAGARGREWRLARTTSCPVHPCSGANRARVSSYDFFVVFGFGFSLA